MEIVIMMDVKDRKLFVEKTFLNMIELINRMNMMRYSFLLFRFVFW